MSMAMGRVAPPLTGFRQASSTGLEDVTMPVQSVKGRSRYAHRAWEFGWLAAKVKAWRKNGL
jgi:hypothetical protein